MLNAIDYRCCVVNISKKDAIRLLSNSVLDNKEVLKQILVQMKHLLKILKKAHLEELISQYLFWC